jgi:hypothetical protein
VARDAGALRDRADVDVAEVDVPTVLALRIAAAGEGGHAPLKRGLGQQAIAPEVRPSAAKKPRASTAY